MSMAIPDVELIEVAASLEQSAEEFLAKRLVTGPAQQERTASALWPELAALGWFDLLLPESAGGLGFPPVVLGGIARVAGRHLLPGPLFEHLLVAPLLFTATTDRASQRRLQAVAGGSSFVALADPAAGVPSADAPRLVGDTLTGVVRLVPHAGRADLLVVVVKDEHGERLFLVDRHGAGVRVEDRAALTATHEVGDVFLDGADATVLPCDAEVVPGLRTWLRVLAAAWLAGSAEQVLGLTVDYVAQRHQFGRAVGSFQAVQHTVADMTAHVHTMTNLVSSTLQAVAGESSGDGETAGLAVKAHCALTGITVCELALQMHGGIGFTTDYPLHRYYKSALALRAYYGEPEELYVELGRRVLTAVGT